MTVLRDKATGTYFEEIRYCELAGNDVILPWGFEVEVTGTWTVRYLDPIPLSERMNVHTDRGSSNVPKNSPVRIRPRVEDPAKVWMSEPVWVENANATR
jgi:hypothetical protein